MLQPGSKMLRYLASKFDVSYVMVNRVTLLAMLFYDMG